MPLALAAPDAAARRIDPPGPTPAGTAHAGDDDTAHRPHDADSPARAPRAARDALVEQYLPLARQLARRYSQRGEALEDLEQVACVGLLRAADRFDPDFGTAFASFAVPTILGEIRRHFRDHGWSVRVPRRVQEVSARLRVTQEDLTGELGSAPTVGQLAERVGLPVDDVLSALDGARAYSAQSLSAPLPGEDDFTLADSMGADDERLERVEEWESVAPLIAALPVRERRILVMRFYGNHTQSEIASRLGISQMHVSRLLAGTLARLRHGVVEPGG